MDDDRDVGGDEHDGGLMTISPKPKASPSGFPQSPLRPPTDCPVPHPAVWKGLVTRVTDWGRVLRAWWRGSFGANGMGRRQGIPDIPRSVVASRDQISKVGIDVIAFFGLFLELI